MQMDTDTIWREAEIKSFFSSRAAIMCKLCNSICNHLTQFVMWVKSNSFKFNPKLREINSVLNTLLDLVKDAPDLLHISTPYSAYLKCNHCRKQKHVLCFQGSTSCFTFSTHIRQTGLFINHIETCQGNSTQNLIEAVQQN